MNVKLRYGHKGVVKRFKEGWPWHMAFLLLGALFAGATLAYGATDSVWLKDTPPTYASRDITAELDPQENADACFSLQAFTIARYEPFTSFEKRVTERKPCTVETPYGTVSNDGYVRFSRDILAVKLKRPDNSNVTPLMIPNTHKLFVVESDGSIGVYDNFVASRQTVTNPDTTYTIWRDKLYYQIPQKPDHYITDKAGNVLRGLVSYDNMAHAANGNYFLLAIKGKTLIKVDAETLAILTIGDLRSSGNVPPFDQTIAISNDGRYVALAGISRQDDGREGNQYKLRVYDTVTCQTVSATYDGLPANGCEFRDYYTLLQSKLDPNGMNRASGMRFSADGTELRATLALTTGKNIRITLTAPGQQASGIEYLALGDSFSSGEGDLGVASYYEPGTDGDGIVPSEFANQIETKKERCHISRRSYPYLLAQQMQLSPTQFKSVACSGAMTGDILGIPNDILSDSNEAAYLGQNKNISRDLNLDEIDRIHTHAVDHFMPGRNAQIEFIHKYKPKIITLSIGGNDIGFADKLKTCIMSALNPVPGPAPICEYVEERRALEGSELQAMYATLYTTYRKIRQASESSKLYVVGYPNFIDTGGTCQANVHLDTAEREYVREAIRYLNQVIKNAAIDAGAYYIDIEQSLENRALCSDSERKEMAFNGLQFGNDTPFRGFGPVGQESYHPNQKGHSLIKDTILTKAGGSLALYNPCTAGVDGDPNAHRCGTSPITRLGVPPVTAYFDSPTTGIGTYARIMLDDLKRSTTEAINFATSVVNGSFKLTLHSEPVDLGTFTTDSKGMLKASFTVPDVVKPGYHTLHAEGKLPSGEPIDYYQVVFVQGPEGDIDDDGTLDADDPCPFVTPAYQDKDHDDIDDGCDGYVGDPPVLAAPTVRMPEIIASGNQREVNISGRGEVGATAVVSVDDKNALTAAVTANGVVEENGYAVVVDTSSLDDGEITATVVLKKEVTSPPGLATSIKDTRAPTITATSRPTFADAMWSREEVEVELRAADDREVAQLVYKAAGAQPIDQTTVSSTHVKVKFTAEGETTLTYYAVDKAGNREAPRLLTIRYDKTAPTVAINKPAKPLLISMFGEQLTGRAFDSLSGVGKIGVNFTNKITGKSTILQATCVACGTNNATWSVSPRELPLGLYAISASSTDKALNTGLQTPPIFLLLVNPWNLSWHL